MKARRPCAGISRRDCRFTEDEFVRSNKHGGEAYNRAFYRRKVAEGVIPPTCRDCGFAHPPKQEVPR